MINKRSKILIILILIISFLIINFLREKRIEITLLSGVEKEFPIELVLNNEVIYRNTVSRSEIIHEIVKTKTSKLQNVIHLTDLNSNKTHDYKFTCFWNKFVIIIFNKEQSDSDIGVTIEESYFESFPL